MKIPARIRQVRLENSLSLDLLALKSGIPAQQLARFEAGKEIPALEMFDLLASTMDVPVARFFYGKRGSRLTPYLSRRLSLAELANELPPAVRSSIGSLFDTLFAVANTRISRLIGVPDESRRKGADSSPTRRLPTPPAEAKGDLGKDDDAA